MPCLSDVRRTPRLVGTACRHVETGSTASSHSRLGSVVGSWISAGYRLSLCVSVSRLYCIVACRAAETRNSDARTSAFTQLRPVLAVLYRLNLPQLQRAAGGWSLPSQRCILSTSFGKSRSRRPPSTDENRKNAALLHARPLLFCTIGRSAAGLPVAGPPAAEPSHANAGLIRARPEKRAQ